MMSFITIIILVSSLIGVSKSAYPVITFVLMEQEKIGHLVGSIAEKSKEHLDTNRTDLRYYFVSPSSYESMFSLNDSTGKLYTSVVLDRENICLHQTECRLSFDVGIYTSDRYFLQIFTVTILVEDKNDNAPMFPSNQVTLNMSEASQIGFTCREMKAMDNDSGANNSIQSYHLIESQETKGTFTLEEKRNFDGRLSSKLCLAKFLDRETRNRYELQIVATDGGDPPKSGSVTVTVEVTDFNDHAPEFSESLYNVTVNETMKASETILVLTATDQDIGKNAEVFFRLSEYQTNRDVFNLFTVDASGEINAKVGLMSKAGDVYKFFVEAVDKGDEPLVAQAEVMVNIVDAGNNAPTVTVGIIGQGNVGFVNIPENANNGTFVAHVNVDDPDTGLNGVVTCKVSNPRFGIDTLGEKGFKVFVKSVFDREVTNVYNVTVTCLDKGTPALSGTTNFLVRITDINDNHPKFEKEVYTAKITENNNGDERIIQVSATDPDEGRNSDIHYACHPDALNHFIIDSNTGIVRVNTTFNRETNLTVTFRVLAIDNGKLPLTGTATIILAIDDENDNAPKFNKSVHGFRFLENQGTGTNVARLDAYDIDAGTNAEFDFSLAPDYVGKVPFVLLPNGLLKVNKQLDREERSRYDFVAIVTDHGERRLSSSSHVTVIVDDMNDNAPVLTFPNPANNSVSVAYPDYENDFVAQIDAYDLDEGMNKELVYSIKSGDGLDIFLLEPTSGLLVFNTRLDIGADKTVALEISVKDKGYLTQETVTTLYVELKYTNGTYLGSTEDNSTSKYVIISVVVVVVTLIISGAIIALILVLRTLDKKRKKAVMESDSNVTDSSDFGFTGTQSHMIFSPDALSSGSGDGKDLIKKKEVSFSLDTTDSTDYHQQVPTGSSANTSQDKSTKFSTRFSSTSRGKSPQNVVCYTPTPSGESPRNGLDTRNLQKEANVQLHSLKLQQVLLQNRAKQWVQAQQQQFGVAPHEDHHSDGSAETIGSDSGRGCSEEEDVFSSTPSADDTKTFETTSHDCLPPPPPPSSLGYSSPPPQSNPYSQRIPPAYNKQPWSCRPQLSHRDLRSSNNYISNDKKIHRKPTVFTTDDVLHNYHDDVEHFSNRASWRGGHDYQGMITPLDYTGDSSMHSFFEKTAVGFGRDDDDNCSTTTSGSYTINSEEIL